MRTIVSTGIQNTSIGATTHQPIILEAATPTAPIPPEGWRVVLYSKTGAAHITTMIPGALPDSPGVAVEGLIQQIVNGLLVVQKGPFKSRANALAITKLEEARHWLLARTDDEGVSNG